MVDETTGDVVDKEDKGRGYEISKGKYVEIEDEELEAIQIEATHTIDIDNFVVAHKAEMGPGQFMSGKTHKFHRLSSQNDHLVPGGVPPT